VIFKDIFPGLSRTSDFPGLFRSWNFQQKILRLENDATDLDRFLKKVKSFPSLKAHRVALISVS